MHEQLYRTKDGTYFLHFEGGPKSRYGLRVGFYKNIGRSGNYKMEEEEDESIIEESEFLDDDLIPVGDLEEDEIPF